MRRICQLILMLAAVQITAAEKDTVLPVPNGGFEDGIKGWKLNEPTAMCTV